MCCSWTGCLDTTQFELSTTSLNLCQTANFFRSQGWPLYTGLSVFYSGKEDFFRSFAFVEQKKTHFFKHVLQVNGSAEKNGHTNGKMVDENDRKMVEQNGRNAVNGNGNLTKRSKAKLT